MLQYKNPLLDEDFLIKLHSSKQHEIYARVIALTFQESPVELIEGKVTQGSINIDGASAVRRTCNLTLVANELNINDFNWGLKSKFKLEIGLKNVIDTEDYPEIIWFPQGVYLITNFSTSHSTNNYTITINGRDKMALLNGDLGGSLPSSIDFGAESYYDVENNTTTITKIPIKTIIKEALHAYALEPYHNIIINDLDDTAVELLEYRGDSPLYLLYDINQDAYVNFTDSGKIKVAFFTNENKYEESDYFNLEELTDKGGYFDSRVELAPEAQVKKPSVLVFQNDSEKTRYNIAKIEHGQTVGYRKTELTYAGDLISNVGESLTSIFDKIKAMLGTYEYFYDIEGRFIFQKKKIYTNNTWNNIVTIEDETFVEDATTNPSYIYRFDDNQLITAFNNTPNLNNLKNDYSIWGVRKSAAGADIPIHYRYAIDIKPLRYNSISFTEDEIQELSAKYPNLPTESVRYDIDEYDWREIIYRMALDYFKYNQLDNYATKLAEANMAKDFDEESLYQYGQTGYEHYYTDIQGFWRQLYNPEIKLFNRGNGKTFDYSDSTGNLLPLYVKGKYKRVYLDEIDDYENVFGLVPFSKWAELHPLLDLIKIPNYTDDSKYILTEDGLDKQSVEFYVKNEKDKFIPVLLSNRDKYNKSQLYVFENETYKTLLESSYIQSVEYVLYKYNDDGEYYNVLDYKEEEPILFGQIFALTTSGSKTYRNYYYKTEINIDGSYIVDTEKEEESRSSKIDYIKEECDYIEDEESDYKYWTKTLIDNPAALNFWFDFLDAESELGQFSVPAIGDRAKAINDNSVTAIYFRQVPNLIFTTKEEYDDLGLSKDSGYNIVYVNANLESMFNVSSQGKSAQDALDELLYNHSYCIETVSIQAIPIYHLQPNTRIYVKDKESKVDGEYIVSKITIPLAYNGIMSINATKAPVRIY